MLALLYLLQELDLDGTDLFLLDLANGVSGRMESKGYVRHSLNFTDFDLPSHYDDPAYIGRGTFGNVCRAVDRHSNQIVAVKKFADPFRSGDVAKKTYREIRLLRILSHENIIELLDVYSPESSVVNFENIYVVTTHAGADLKQVMDSNPGQLTDAHFRFIVYQLLRGLKYLHSANIVHRDLKPKNVCISPDCDVTILDFGMARKISKDIMTEYVVTRFYRAPEIVYWSGKYDPKADVWSVGCILAELLQGGRPLFPGENSPHQFALITKLCGSPDALLLAKIQEGSTEETRKYIEEKMPSNPRQDFYVYFAGAHLHAIDLLEKILVLDPDLRISVDDALQHPYLLEHHDQDDEPLIEHDVDLDDEIPGKENIKGWKKKIWKEIESYNRSQSSGPVESKHTISASSASTSSVSKSMD